MASVFKNCVDFLENLTGTASDLILEEELSRYKDDDTTSFSLSEVVQQINSDLIHVQIEGLRQLKLHVSKDGLVLINAVVESGYLPKFFEFLRHDNLDLVFEAISILKFIAFGANPKIESLIDLENYRVLCKLLFSTRFDIVEQIVWFVGGISLFQSSSKYVDKLVSQILLIQDHPEHGLPLIRALAWTLSGILIKNAKSAEIFLTLIIDLHLFPTKARLVTAVIGIYKLSSLLNLDINTVHKSRFVAIPTLINFLISDDYDVAMLSLRAITLILLEDPNPSPIILEGAFLSTLYEFIYNPQVLTQYETMSCIAVIMSKSPESAIAIANSELFPIINGRLINPDNHELQMQCLCFFAIYLRIAPERLDLLHKFEVLNALSKFMKRFTITDEVRFIVLNVMTLIISAARRFGELRSTVSILKRNKGMKRLEELQFNNNFEIAITAIRLVTRCISSEIPMNHDNANMDEEDDLFLPKLKISITQARIRYSVCDEV